MVNLYVKKSQVMLMKTKSIDYRKFVNSFLVKYEEVLKPDRFSSRGSKKAFKSVKERRDLYTDCGDFITFSRGILELIPQDEYQLSFCNVENELITPTLTIDEIIKTLPDSYDLRIDQAIAVNKCLIAKRGVIQMPTATGKSSIIVSVVKRLLEVNPHLKALVLAPTLSTVDSINRSFIKNHIPSKIYGHPDKDFNFPVTTSLVQSLVSSEDLQVLKDVNAVFYDECLPGNSRILLPDGTYRKISEIYSDDLISQVLSYNLDLNCYEVKNIIHKYKTPYNRKFCKVYYKDKFSNKVRGISCTNNHKIWTRDRGYVPAEDLNDTDYIKIDYPNIRDHTSLNKYTYCKVDSVVFNIGGTAQYKYNLEVEDNHNYFAENVLVSNCHHLKCDTWNKLNSMLPNVEYSLGFSALAIDRKEIYEKDFRNISYNSALIIGSSGRVLMHMDPSYYIERGIIALPVVFRIQHSEKLPSNIEESDWHKVVKYGIMSTVRTDKISRATKMFSRYGRKVLILVSERDYGFMLAKYIVQLGETKIGISFGAGQGFVYQSHQVDEEKGVVIDYQKVNSLEVLDQLSEGQLNIVIGTSHIDEGVDISKLDVVILACGGKKDRRIVQRIGRVLRKSKSGKYAYVVDFTDDGSAVLSRQSRTRLNMYKKDIGVPVENIFDGIHIEEIENKFKELERLT